jgi:hypothetical protein
MGVGTYERKSFVGGAPATSLSAGINDSATALVLAASTGWPSADTNPFVAVIDRGTASEEKVLIRARTGTACSDVVRGYDDTTALAHDAGATMEHALDASTIDQVNRMANLMNTLGQVIGHNGTNPVAITAVATNGFVLTVDTGESANLAFARPIHVVLDPSAPTVTAVPRLWLDQNQTVIRVSDGATWIVPSQALQFASNAARDAYLGDPPDNAGHVALVGSGSSLQLQVHDGTAWTQIARLDRAIPRFADTTARNAFYTSPSTGDTCYITGTHQMLQYRDTEWILINQKITTSAVAPTGAKDGDVWLQPTS